MTTIQKLRNRKRTILEILRSPMVTQKEKDKLWATFKFCCLPRWYRKMHRKEYPNLDYEKVNEFERLEAMKIKKEFR